MQRNIKNIGLLNFIILLVAGGVSIVLARYCHSLSGQVAAVFFGIGALIALISYFQSGLEEKEQIEKLEFDEISREKNAASLFSTEAETFPARRSREQFERFFLPGFTVLLFITEGAAAFFLWRWLDNVIVQNPRQQFVALALYSVLALVLFLLGKYSANVARFENERLLRPSASFLVLGAYLCGLIVTCFALIYFGVPRADLFLARGLAILLGLAALESLINLILEIYRPRVRGKQERLVYESRLLGLLSQPEGIFTTAAQALDYQFGFKVSETWFYRFMEKALAWLILIQFLVLVISSCFVFVDPGEQALLERWGRPREAVLNPGIHLKAPWPIDKVYRFHTDKIQSFRVGTAADTDHGRTITWNVPHEEQPLNLMVASREGQVTTDTNSVTGAVPVDLLTVGIPVQYQIQDIKAFAYNHVNSSNLLQRLAYREVVRYLVGVDLFDILSKGKAKAASDLQTAIQKAADSHKMGVRIVMVGLEDLHPPQKVAVAFENVVGARQESEAAIRHAEGYALSHVEMARGESVRLVKEAEGYRFQRVASADAQATRFQQQMKAFDAAPEVYATRAKLQTLVQNSTNVRFIVKTSTNTHDIYQLDLQEKITPDISDIPIPTKR
ncbi:MAG TPA: protease modulator HflK [Verrucomicrobiae bacterium]